MRFFTDVPPAAGECADPDHPDAGYDVLLVDGRRIHAPDYATLLKTIATLDATSWRVRVHGGDAGRRPVNRG